MVGLRNAPLNAKDLDLGVFDELTVHAGDRGRGNRGYVALAHVVFVIVVPMQLLFFGAVQKERSRCSFNEAYL